MKKSSIILVVILLLAATLRLYKLGQTPLGLFGDEIDAGYNAYSFLKTGKDYNGNFLPIHFESMGDYRPFGFILALVPSIGIFGLNDFSVRLTPAIMGILGVWFIYLLTKRNLHPFIAILCSLLLAITPWHIHYSRFALEETYMTALLLLSSYLFIKSFNHPVLFPVSSFLFAFNSYSYNIAKLFSPLLLIAIILIYRKKITKIPLKYLALSIFIFLITLSPLAYDTLFGSGQVRFNNLNILNSSDLVANINYSRGQLENLPPFIGKLFHNKVISLIKIFFNNYFSSFDFSFLYTTGQATEPRHSLPGFGLFFTFLLPFTVIGLHRLLNKLNQPFNQLLLTWLLIAPLPSALTIDGGQHASRVFVLLPPLIIITAIGIHFCYQKISSYSFRFILSLAILLLLTFNLTFYLQSYYFHYSSTYFRSWQYGMKPAIQYALQHQNEYDHLIFTTNYVNLPMLYYVFYSQYPPHLLQQQFLHRKLGTAEDPTYRINKFTFTTYTSDDSTQPENSLYIAVPQDYNYVWHIIGQLDSPDPNDNQPLLLYLSSR